MYKHLQTSKLAELPMRKLVRWEYLQGNREKERERVRERRKKIWKQVMHQGSRQVLIL